MNIFKYNKKSLLNAKKNKSAGHSPSKKDSVHDEFNIRNENKASSQEQLKLKSEKFDLLEELQRQREDENDEEGFTIEKELIIEAWKRYRPLNLNDGNSRKSRSKNPRTKQTEIKEILGEIFTEKLMANIHQKIYDYSETQE